jgi:hypothetical protein
MPGKLFNAAMVPCAAPRQRQNYAAEMPSRMPRYGVGSNFDRNSGGKANGMEDREASGSATRCGLAVAVLLAGMALPPRAEAGIAPGLACSPMWSLPRRAVVQPVAQRPSAHPRRHRAAPGVTPPPMASAGPIALRAFFTCPSITVPRPGSGWHPASPPRWS